MPGTIEFPLLPEEAVTLGPRLAVIETPKELVFMNASGPLMSCSRNDVTAKRYIGAVLMAQGLTKGEDLVVRPRSSDHNFGSSRSSGSHFVDGGKILA